MGWAIAIALVAAFVALMIWGLQSAPSCTCGDVECGGGCIRKRKR